jgi:hypothetical protein
MFNLSLLKTLGLLPAMTEKMLGYGTAKGKNGVALTVKPMAQVKALSIPRYSASINPYLLHH